MLRPAQQDTLAVDRSVAPANLATNTPVFFHHNWRQPVRVSSTFLTQDSEATYSLSQVRAGVKLRPQRRVTSLHSALGYDQMQQLQMFDQQASPSFTLGADPTYSGLNLVLASPLYCDTICIDTVQDLGGGSWRFFLNLRTLYRFNTGARAWLFNQKLIPISGFEFLGVLCDLVDVQTNYLDVAIPGGVIPTSGMSICPSLDVLPSASGQIDSLGSGAAEFQREVFELPTESALPGVSSAIGGLLGRYDGYPTFVPEHNWRDPELQGYSRVGGSGDSVNSALSVLNGTNPVHTTQFLVTMYRLDFWNILRLFDASRGGLVPFWVGTEVPLSIHSISVATGTTVTLEKQRPLIPYRAVWLRPKNGTGDPIIRRVVSVVGTTLTLDASVDAGEYYPYIAYLGVFTSDALEETWYTTDVVECRFSTIELNNELPTLDP